MNTQQRAVVQQALEALEFCQAPVFRPDRSKREEAITALRQLLEQREQADHIRDATKMVATAEESSGVEPRKHYQWDDGMRLLSDIAPQQKGTP